MISEIMKKMIEYDAGCAHDIAHLLKVWGYARTIGQLEKLDDETQETLEIAAIVHDIACPFLRKKYGTADGKLQEIEGPALAKAFFEGTGIPEKMLDRVVYLIAHHHTLTGINGMDYQILIEADYLVNADESNYAAENIQNTYRTVFKTTSGREFLKNIFGLTE